MNLNLKELQGVSSKPCVSIYLPTHTAGAEIDQDMIRFKNLLRTAAKELKGNGHRQSDIDKMLEPAEELLQSRELWRQPTGGFACFIAPDTFETDRLAEPVEEKVVVGPRFHLRPLIPMISAGGDYYVLGLSQEDIRLFSGTRNSFNEVTLEDFPTSLREVLETYEQERHRQQHSATGYSAERGRGSTSPAMIQHGHGGKNEVDKDRILELFRQVDKGIKEYLRSTNAPLVLAGVDFLHPIYQQANTYPNLVEEAGVRKNFREMSREELHEQSWSAISPLFDMPQKKALDQFRQLHGTGKTSTDIHEILPAAAEGRIAALFIDAAGEQPGWYDLEKRSVTLVNGKAATHGPDSEDPPRDLLEEAALHAIEAQAPVFTLEREAIPEKAQAAALFRY